MKSNRKLRQELLLLKIETEKIKQDNLRSSEQIKKQAFEFYKKLMESEIK